MTGLETGFQAVAENLWIRRYPLKLLGTDLGRVVSIIRLSSGKLIIHSTGPFTASDLRQIDQFGRPAWLVDVMLRHDTFAEPGRRAFSTIPYLVPPGFEAAARLQCRPLDPIPEEWTPDVEVALIEGMPKVNEYVFLHRPSRTLIVADLVFNFEHASGWKAFVQRTLLGVHLHPDSARVYPHQIHDRPAFERSIRRILSWDFDRIIVGHHQIVATDGKSRLNSGLASKGLLPPVVL